MPYNPQIHHRQSIRLRHRDYTAPGFYFLTICTHQRQHLFGDIRDGSMVLNTVGQAAEAHWLRLTRHFAHIRLDEFVVMPNHIHGIIQIVELPNVSDVDDADWSPPTCDRDKTDRSPPTSRRGEAFCESRFSSPECNNQNASPLRSVDGGTDRPHGTPPGSIGAIAGNPQSVSTRQINRLRRSPGSPVWQRNYHDRILRTAQELHNVRAYIQTNPQTWDRDSVVNEHR